MLARTVSPAADHAHWPITETESRDLAKKTRAWLNTIDKKKLDQLEKKYGKYIPGGQLVVALGVITLPRVMQSVDNHKSHKGPRRVDVRPQESVPAPAVVPEPGPVHVNGNSAATAAAPVASGQEYVASDAARASAGRFDPTEPEPDAEAVDGIRPLRASDGRAFDFDAN
jgi:hypothetical protein